MARDKVIIRSKRSGRYIAGIVNGHICTSLNLGEAWLMYVCEWIELCRIHKLEENRYEKLWVTLRK